MTKPLRWRRSRLSSLGTAARRRRERPFWWCARTGKSFWEHPREGPNYRILPLQVPERLSHGKPGFLWPVPELVPDGGIVCEFTLKQWLAGKGREDDVEDIWGSGLEPDEWREANPEFVVRDQRKMQQGVPRDPGIRPAL